MPRKARGGAQIWCSKCRSITACKGVEPKEIKKYLKRGRRWYMKEHEDVHWFQRGRICQSCGHGFITSEVNREFLDELIELRDALGEIKKNTEEYIEKSKEASLSLEELNSSFNKLKAMKIYLKEE